MSHRSRPRHSAALIESDAEEERTIWTAIQSTLRVLCDVNAQAEEVAGQIMQLETALKEKEDETNQNPTVEQITKLEDLYREGVRLAEEEHRILKEEGIIDNVEVLMALRDAPVRSSLPPISKHSKASSRPKRKLGELAVEIPRRPASPLTPGISSRLKSASGNLTGRSASIPIKLEAGTTPTMPMSEHGKTDPNMIARLSVGSVIVYRLKPMKSGDPEGMLCKILSVRGEGARRFLKFQDTEGEGGKPGRIYDQRYSPQTHVIIPPPDVDIERLPHYAEGEFVLGIYPNSNCFYEAKVTEPSNGPTYNLIFEGETDGNIEIKVDRRFIIEMLKK